jgi:phosphohistidine phosphatase
MTKQLFLLRHGEAADKTGNQSDKDRELTTAGIQHIMRMAAHLAAQNLPVDAIYCSSGLRARQTALLLLEKIDMEDDKIFFEDDLYDASTRTLMEFISRLDNSLKSVMIVGHNPALSYVAEYLTDTEVGSMAPGGIAIVRLTVSSWKEITKGAGELVQYFHPEALEKIEFNK